MEEVRTEVTLVAYRNKYLVRRGYLPEEDVKQLLVMAAVNTGAFELVINEDTREKLGLEMEESWKTTVVDGETVHVMETEAVEVHWKERRVAMNARVVSDGPEVVLGRGALFAMDLMVCPETGKVVGVHGDKELHRV